MIVFTMGRQASVMPKTYYNCPISEEPVHEVLPRAADFVEFFCPTCGQFRIAKTAIGAVKDMPQSEREALLTAARLNAQGGVGIPFISSIH